MNSLLTPVLPKNNALEEARLGFFTPSQYGVVNAPYFVISRFIFMECNKEY